MIHSKPSIGILTFHCAENYGAFLQTYAMQTWLEQHMGEKYNIEIIDYRPDYLIDPYKIRIVERIQNAKTLQEKCKALIIALVEVPNKVVRKCKFVKSRKHYRTSKKIYTNKEFALSSNYFALILGSDQIWNPYTTKGLDPVYFGTPGDDKCRKIAYAASLGISSYSESEKKQMKDYLKNIYAIGVREVSSLKILNSLTDKKINLNCDPTLLVNREVWRQRVNIIKHNKYILIYRLQNNDSIFTDAYKIAKEKKLEILHFGDPSIKPMYKDIKVQSLSFCGPFDFINYIFNAEIVLTNSFHATCFSIIFEKNFFTYLQNNRSQRLVSLAEIGGFEDRLVDYKKHLEINRLYDNELSDVSLIYKNLKSLRVESEHYLLSALEG